MAWAEAVLTNITVTVQLVTPHSPALVWSYSEDIDSSLYGLWRVLYCGSGVLRLKNEAETEAAGKVAIWLPHGVVSAPYIVS